MEEKIFDDEKLEILSDEELDVVVGGAATIYYSKPFVNNLGKEVVQVVTVGEGGTFDAATGKFRGYRGCVSVSASRIDEYIDRQKGRGMNAVGLNIAGPLVYV